MSGEVVASIATNSHSVFADCHSSVASSNLVTVAALSAQQRSAGGATILNFNWRAAVSGIDCADLSILRAASLVLGAVASVGFSTEVLSSRAQLDVVGTELSLRIVAALPAEVPADGAQDRVFVADLGSAAVAGTIAESVVVGRADVVIDAGEAGSIDALAFTAEIDSFSCTVRVVVASLGKDERNAHRD